MLFRSGELAQLVERCDRTAEVRGSSPLFSIWLFPPIARRDASVACGLTSRVGPRREGWGRPATVGRCPSTFAAGSSIRASRSRASSKSASGASPASSIHGSRRGPWIAAEPALASRQRRQLLDRRNGTGNSSSSRRSCGEPSEASRWAAVSDQSRSPPLVSLSGAAREWLCG